MQSLNAVRWHSSFALQWELCKKSGYNEILDSALEAFSKMMEDVQNDVKSLSRSTDWEKREMETLRKNQKLNWYKDVGKTKISYKSELFVPPTTEQMKKREEEINKGDWNKTVEKSGVDLENIPSKKDSFNKEKF